MCQSDTFGNAVDCRSELAVEVQRWTRAHSDSWLSSPPDLPLIAFFIVGGRCRRGGEVPMRGEAARRAGPSATADTRVSLKKRVPST